MNKRINSLWKLCLITIVLFSWTIKSNAQTASLVINQTKIVAPIVKIISNLILSSESNLPTIENKLENEKSYLNSSLFFFEENIQVCRDILTRTNDSIDILNVSIQTEEQIQIKEDTVLKKEKAKVVKKNKHKSIWNHPGNTKSRI